MKSLQEYINESFNDPILTEFYKFAKSLSKDDSEILIHALQMGNKRFDLHKGSSDSLINLSNATRQEIQSLLSSDINNKWGRTNSSTYMTQFYVFKIQYNDLILFGLCYLWTWGEKFNDCIMLLPDSLREKPNIEAFEKPAIGCTKLGRFIKQGAKVTGYSYYGNGNYYSNELLQLRDKRAESKKRFI